MQAGGHAEQAGVGQVGAQQQDAANEELRSVTQELETSKEELQSLNEELTTVNAQLAEVPSDYKACVNVLLRAMREHFPALVFNLPPDPNSAHTVPWQWGTTGIAYRSKHVTEDVTTWEQFFEVAGTTYEGKTVIVDHQISTIGYMITIAGVALFFVNLFISLGWGISRYNRLAPPTPAPRPTPTRMRGNACVARD